MTEPQALERLRAVLLPSDPLAVAVSGGVDSLTLALVLGRTRQTVYCYHARSAAVPPRATERVRVMAEQEGWVLREVSAGELEDADYVANPVDRCFYCKSKLYATIREHTDRTIASGTNRDDLTDFRPGLEAAEAFGVRHPFVEAEVRKAEVRALALFYGYLELSQLPASPCLSSRVETGIRIDATALDAVGRAEEWIRRTFDADVVRCRVRREELTVELAPELLGAISAPDRRTISEQVRSMMPPGKKALPVRIAEYRRGSAFVRASEP